MAKTGRKARTFTDEQRRIIESMSAIGIPQESIAEVMGCDAKTLRKQCHDELAQGPVKANARVGQFLYQQAQINLTAAIFWAKTRMGWREKQDIKLESDTPLIAVIKEK